MNYIICCDKPWINDNFLSNSEVILNSKLVVKDYRDLNEEILKKTSPDFIFFIHWSSFINKKIFLNFKCIIFHMTDLPYGRGGSPLQNLLSRDKQETVLSAFLCNENFDAGPIILKKPLSLLGGAEEIYIRMTKLSLEMITVIISNKLQYFEQSKGNFEEFKRKKKSDSEIIELHDINSIYEKIRMLDANGYPNAFLKIGKIKFEFSRASRKVNHILADVKITKEE